ncbi:TrbI/VirB10 family protein [Acidithiobacillus caldus]
MKSGKELFSSLFGKRGKDGNTPQNDSASGPAQASQPIALKGSGDARATRIRKTPLYVGLAVVGLAGYAAVEYMQSHNPLSGGHPVKEQTIKPAQPTSGPAIPETRNRYTKPVAPATSSSSSGQTTPTSVTTTSSANQTAPKPKNPFAAQDAAFEASIGGGSGGGGGLGLSWQQPQTTQPPSGNPAALSAALTTEPKAQARKAPKPPLVTRETSPYELLQGAVIPAVLEDGIKSYLPGEIRAVVSQNVYSSVNGATLLIPAGSRLVGTYDTRTTMGINRLAVAWTRIEFPNGTYMNLPGFEGAGGSGYAGFAGEVNDHTWLVFKNALLLSLVNVGMAVASPTSTSTNTTGVTGNEALQDGEQSLAQTFGQAEAQLLQRYIDIAPTITIHPGYVFNVVVAHDLVFPGPYNPAMQTGPAQVHRAIAPKPNPFGPGVSWR